MVPNNTGNVSTARGVAGGYLLSAQRTSSVVYAIPSFSNLSRPLPAAFENLGYVASDGITESESASTRTDVDVDGRPIGTTRYDRTEEVRVRLVESRAASISERHGHANVEVTDGVATVHHNNLPREHRVYVAELVLDGGRRLRKVIPDGQVIEVGDLALSSTELVGREVTIGCNAHTWQSGNESHTDTVIDFMELGPIDGGSNIGSGDTGGASVDPSVGSGTALLSSLTASATLSPAFSPQATEYAATTSSQTFTVSAVPDDPAATMSVARLGGVQYPLASGTSRSFELAEGSNSVWVWVTNPNTSQAKTYKITVTYAP